MTNEEQKAYDLTVENHERAMFRAAELERENKALEDDYLRIISAQDEKHRAKVAELRQHKTDYMEAAEGTRKALLAEIAALKAQPSGAVITGMADALRHVIKELDAEACEDIDYAQVSGALGAYELFGRKEDDGQTYMGEPLINSDVLVERGAMQRLFKACGCSGAVDNTQIVNLAANKLEAITASAGGVDERAAFEATFPGYKAMVEDAKASRAAGKRVEQPSNMFRVWLHCRAALAQSERVPEGWQLVPVEPTEDMREAFHQAQEQWEDGGYDSPDHQWEAMLAAAPSPSKQGGV